MNNSQTIRDWEKLAKEFISYATLFGAVSQTTAEIIADWWLEKLALSRKEALEEAVADILQLETVEGSITDGFKACVIYSLNKLKDK